MNKRASKETIFQQHGLSNEDAFIVLMQELHIPIASVAKGHIAGTDGSYINSYHISLDHQGLIEAIFTFDHTKKIRSISYERNIPQAVVGEEIILNKR